MAEFVADLLGPAIGVVAELVAEPVKDQFTNLCCFNSITQNLRDEAGKLDDAKKGLQMRVDREKDNLQIILPEVETWLRNSEELTSDKDIILNEVSNVESGLMTAGARINLSKRAKRTAGQMKELRDQCKFRIISLPPPPAATEAVPQGPVCEFESRKHIEEDIMEALRSVDVNMIGICGMGGVGKTTMANKILNRTLEEHLFDEVVIVVFGQQVDNLRIQLDIGGQLGLNLKNDTTRAIVQKLLVRLSDPKRKLLILDDVWRRLSLDDFGITCGSGCKILVTSRNRDVLSAMSIQKICGVPILSPTEAWFLFREKAGMCVDATELKTIANKVVQECKGLPIALATVGLALKDENRLSIWKDSLGQLTKANPIDMDNVIADVYKPLKWSYDLLESNNQKSIFLLCSLFREDDNIPIEHLTYISMGLHMLEGISELEDARNRMCQLIKKLKNRFLLLDGRDEYHVRMHDVIRDVSTFIAREKGLINCNDCRWISSYVEGRPRFSVETFLTNLHLVMLDNGVEPKFEINDIFTERTRELNVLFIRGHMLKSIPSVPQLLKNLVTLVIYNCVPLEIISSVGHLVSLEILIVHDCSSLQEVPVEWRLLKRLRLLEISRCKHLKRVAPGVISSLVALEELKMLHSFRGWEADVDGKERKNAGLEELESLSNLRCLEIVVKDSTLAAVHLRLSPSLVKFNVTFGGLFGPTPTKHKILDCWFGENFLGDLSANTFLRSTECLSVNGGSNVNMDLANAQNIRKMSLFGIENMKNITAASVNWRSGAVVFPLLESLSLAYIDSLEEVWDGPIPSNSFKNLKELDLQEMAGLTQLWRSPNHSNVVPIFTNLSSIFIMDCHVLGHVFSSANAEDCTLQLERIEIYDCEVMEQVLLVQNVEDEEITDIQRGSQITRFPKLKILSLDGLPKLMSICKGIESIEFPELTELEIQRCPDMNCLVVSPASSDDLVAGINHDHYHDLDSTHLFCEPKVSFCKLRKLIMREISNKNAWCDKVPMGFFRGLEKLEIANYSNIRSLFSSSIAENLVNLQRMIIGDCSKMVKVIEDDEETFDGRTKCLFPRLQELRLRDLPKLESFCEWRCSVELPSLKTLDIDDCPELKSLNAGSGIAPALQTIKSHGQVLASSKDLNAAMQQHFTKSQVSFGNLKYLTMGRMHGVIKFLWASSVGLEKLEMVSCSNIRSLFSSSMAQNPFNLKKMIVSYCKNMVNVIEEKEDEKDPFDDRRKCLLPGLQELYLSRLIQIEENLRMEMHC